MRNYLILILILATSAIFAQGKIRTNELRLIPGSEPATDVEGTMYYNSAENDVFLNIGGVYQRLGQLFRYDIVSLSGNYTASTEDFAQGNRILFQGTSNDYVITIPQDTLDLLTTGDRLEFEIGKGATGTLRVDLPSTDYDFEIISDEYSASLIKGPGSFLLRRGGFADYTFDVTAPTIPTNFAVANTTINSITYTWDASPESDVSHYLIRIDAGTPVNVGNVLTYQATGLTSSTSYDAEIAVVDITGNTSSYSSPVLTQSTSSNLLGSDPLASNSNADISGDDYNGVDGEDFASALRFGADNADVGDSDDAMTFAPINATVESAQEGTNPYAANAMLITPSASTGRMRLNNFNESFDTTYDWAFAYKSDTTDGEIVFGADAGAQYDVDFDSTGATGGQSLTVTVLDDGWIVLTGKVVFTGPTRDVAVYADRSGNNEAVYALWSMKPE